MSARADLAAALAGVLQVPVYEYLPDHAEVPSVVVYPSPEWIVRNGYDGVTLSFTVTAIARRADRQGGYDELEELVLAVARAPIGDMGATFTSGGSFRVAPIAGVDHLTADLTVTVRTPNT